MVVRARDVQLRLLLLAPRGSRLTELRTALAGLSDAIVIGDVESESAALAMYDASHPDAVLLATDWSDGSTLTTLHTLHCRDPRVALVVINMDATPLRVAAAVGVGARGYMMYESLEDLQDVVRLAARGGIACCSISARQLTERVVLSPELSPRERQIAAQVAAGQTNAEIASVLGIKASTIETHVERILKKITGRTRVDIATWWQRQAGLREAN
jgi:DNA-binding NarL/FixJ family response regulator